MGDGLADKFFNITDQQALSNIVHGKVCTMRTKPVFGYMHFHESELYKMIEEEIDRPENNRYMEELEQEFREMFDRTMFIFFGKGEK